MKQYLLPVLDLMQGRVVHGVAGQRETYRPVISPLCPDGLPGSAARSFAALGFTDVYVADLDAITQRLPQWACLAEIASAGLDIWLDAGVASLSDAELTWTELKKICRRPRLILGLESLPDPKSLQHIAKRVGASLVLSIDLKHGQSLAAQTWPSDPPDIVQLGLDAGVNSFIVLDLAAVGVSAGVPTLDLCQAIRNLNNDIELITGGGVRNSSDVQSVIDSGCNRVLIATALHQGRIVF